MIALALVRTVAVAAACVVAVVAEQPKSILRKPEALQQAVQVRGGATTEFASMCRAVATCMIDREEFRPRLAAALAGVAVGIKHLAPHSLAESFVARRDVRPIRTVPSALRGVPSLPKLGLIASRVLVLPIWVSSASGRILRPTASFAETIPAHSQAWEPVVASQFDAAFSTDFDSPFYISALRGAGKFRSA